MNTTHIKIESDALICMIFAAAFIGYALGIQKMVNAIKPHQYNKYSQTNLSELAELLTLNHIIVNGGGENVQKHSNDSNATAGVNSEETKINEVNHIVAESIIIEEEDKAEGECQRIKSNNKDNEKTNENVSEIIINNYGSANNSEEEYELVTGSIKKSYTKKQHRYYFDWFDSMF